MEAPTTSTHDPLSRYLGSWEGEVSVEAAGAAAERYTQRNTFAWILGGRFLEERGTGSNGSSFIGVWSRPSADALYRAYYFSAPTGDVFIISHEWNEATRTFTGGAELGSGLRMVAADRFLDPDHYEWSITIQDAGGSVLNRMHARERRVAC